MPKQKKLCLDWQPHMAEIQNLYLVQDLSLERLMKYMEETHDFRATKAQYETQLKKWDIRKNLTNEEWNYTLLKVRKRKFHGIESDVYLNGRTVPEKRIKKEMSRHFTLTQEQFFDTVSIPSTPEAITVSTPNATVLAAETNTVLHNLPYFQFQALLESAALFPMSPAQTPLSGTAQQIARDSEIFHLPTFLSRDSHEMDKLALFQKIALLSHPAFSEERQTLLAGLFGLRMNADGDGFLSQILSQMLVSSLERYDGELLEKSQLLCGHSRQSSMLRILECALYRLSNNLLSEKATYDFTKWLIKQQQNVLLASFLKTKIPTVHACATKILENVLWIGDADFLELLIDSGIDISPLKGIRGGRNLECVALQGNMRIAQILLKNGADVNTSSAEYSSTALQSATSGGHADMVQVLLKAGANVDAVSSFSYCNTALSKAVNFDRVELVRILLAAGANIDICTINHQSAIEYSAFYINNDKLQQILLSASSKDDSCITCHGVLEAASTGTLALSKYLAEKGQTGVLVQAVLKLALRIACEDSNYSAVISLLAIAVNEDCLPLFNIGFTLLTAVSSGDFELIKILLQEGADVNTPSILSSAIENDQKMSHGTKMLQFMLGIGADIDIHGEKALRDAVEWKYFEAVQFLLLSGVDVNGEVNDDDDDEFNNATILQSAVCSENIGLVRILLVAGADVNALSRDGLETALETAVSMVDRSGPQGVEIVQVLLAAGADVNIPKSILHVAILDGNEVLISILVKQGADVNSPPIGENGRTPVQAAAIMGNLSLVKVLLESGANINAPAGYYKGSTAIQAASSSTLATMELIDFLLKAGANINAPAGIHYGRTAIQAASSVELPKMELIDFLLDAGADINAPAGHFGGVTALQGAAIGGHMSIALKFLEAGADVNAAAAIVEGRTALDGAAEHGRLDMVQMLLNAGACGDSTKSHRFDEAMRLARNNGHFAIASLLERA